MIRTRSRRWTLARQRALTLVTLALLAYWFFGNLYEAVVFSPNWVVDPAAQLTRLNEFFVVTSPTTYFVPLALLSPLLVWLAAWLNPDPAAAPDLRRAGWVAAVAVALNAVIVIWFATRMVGPGFRDHLPDAAALVHGWNALNLVRLTLSGILIALVFRAFRTLDRQPPTA